MNCVICLEKMVNPVVGKCGHSICGECCNKLVNRKCPTCRTTTYFSKNYDLMKTLDTLGYTSDPNFKLNKEKMEENTESESSEDNRNIRNNQDLVSQEEGDYLNIIEWLYNRTGTWAQIPD